MANMGKFKESMKKATRNFAIFAAIVAAGWFFPWAAAGVGLTSVLVIIVAVTLPKQPLGSLVKPAAGRRVKKAITDEEELLWESRQHPISLWRWWLGVILVPAVVVQAAVSSDIVDWKIATIAILVGITALSLRLWLWRVDRICLTNKRLLTVTGILLKNNKMMPAGKLTDLTVQTPRLSTILAGVGIIQAPYATFIAESAGQDQALSKIWYVPEGGKLEHLIVNLTH